MEHSRRNVLKVFGLSGLSSLVPSEALTRDASQESPAQAAQRAPEPFNQDATNGPKIAAVATLPTVEEFHSPPRRYRPITWYAPQRPNLAEISDDLADLEKFGLGGICVLPGPDLKVEYLSPEFWQTIQLTIEEAVRRNYRIWLYDEYDFPSTSAGGQVVQHCPECAVTGLEYNEGPVTVSGGEVVATVGGATFVKRVGDPLNLMDRGRAAGLGRPLSNLMNANAGREFISLTYEGYARTVGRHFGKEIEAVFTDEPSLHVAGYWDFGEKAEDHRPLLPWVNGFPEYFYTRKGYDLLPLLPCLVRDAGPETANVRCDYYEVVTELIMEGYFEQLHDWCVRHNLASTGHLLLEEWLMTHLMFTGSLIRAASRMSIPGVDLIGERPDAASLENTMAGVNGVSGTGPEGVRVSGVGGVWVPKYISSAAHTRNRSDVMSESFAASGPSMNLEKLVATANWEFVAGVTELLPMSDHYWRRKIPANALETTHDEFYRDPSFFGTYLARLRSLLSGGVHVADVGLLVPETSIWANYVPAPVGMPYEAYRAKNPVAASLDDQFAALSSELLRSQIDFDYLDDEIFVTAEVADGKLHIAGESYKILLLPSATTMRYSVAEKVEAFCRSGGTVIACGKLAMQAVERGKDSLLQKALAPLSLAPTPKDAVQAIRQAGQTDVRLAGADPKIYYLHRRKDGRDIYFVINMAEEGRKPEITFRAHGSASVWDPRTGDIKSFSGGKLGIERLSAIFVVFG